MRHDLHYLTQIAALTEHWKAQNGPEHVLVEGFLSDLTPILIDMVGCAGGLGYFQDLDLGELARLAFHGQFNPPAPVPVLTQASNGNLNHAMQGLAR